MASIIHLRRRVQRLTNVNAEAAAFVRSLKPEGWTRLLVALRAAGMPLPDGDDPFSLSESQRQAWLAEAERLAQVVRDHPQIDATIAATIRRMRVENSGRDGAGWRGRSY